MVKGQTDITVLMPAFNSAPVIQRAIASVLQQRGPSFDFMIIDDGSTDSTCSIVRSYADPRIRLIENGENRGVASTLNRGLDLAKGKYILRMDSDDICYPSRFTRQFQFMEKNPEVGISGTWIRFFGDELTVVDRSPVGSGVIKAYLLFDTPHYHPTVIMRRDFLTRYNLRYDPAFHRTEDYDLWFRAADFFPLENIPEPLLRFRCHTSSVTSTASETMEEQTCMLLRRALLRIGVEPSPDELKFHFLIAKGRRVGSLGLLKEAESWLQKLAEKNQKSGYCTNEDFLQAVGIVWFRLCANSAQLGMSACSIFANSPLSSSFIPPLAARIRFWLSILYHSV